MTAVVRIGWKKRTRERNNLDIFKVLSIRYYSWGSEENHE
jgi:hypothetical protein